METMRYSIKRNRVQARVSGLLSWIVFLVAAVSASSPASAGIVARYAFVSLSSPALEILKRTTRLDMLDYWDADSVFKASNAMEGLSWLEAAGPDYIRVRLTPVSVFEIKLLPFKNKQVVMTVYTVGDDRQAEDSRIDFYDQAMNPLDSKKFFKAPDLSNFFDIPKGSVTTMKEIKEMVPFPTVAYSASADGNNLSARLTVGEYMNIDDYNIIKLFLKPEVILEWKNGYKAR